MKNILLPLALLLSLLACKNTDCGEQPVAVPAQVVFGVSHAECLGDCSRNYKLTPEQLFADDCDFCTLDNITFQKIPLGSVKFDLAKSLLESVTDVVLNTPDTVFGCPGCHDEGAYYLEITSNNEKHVFRWSSDFVDIPEELHPYFEQVRQVLQDLQ